MTEALRDTAAARDEIEDLQSQIVEAVSGCESLFGSAGGRRPPRRAAVVERHVHRGSLGLDLSLPGEAGPPRRLFAKTLRAESWDRHRLDGQRGSRVRLRPVPDPRTQLAHERAALNLVSQMVAQVGEKGWFSVDVAALLLDGRVLVLEHVDRPTLHEAARAGTNATRLIEACRNAGCWLRAFHGLDDLGHTRPRLSDEPALRTLLDRFVDELRTTTGWSPRVDAALASVRANLKPPTLGLGHGNFAPHNMFLGEAGEIGVFDTRAAYRQPIELDLACFLTLQRFPDLRGSWPAWRQTSERELQDGFLEGYGLDPVSGRRAVAAYEVLVLLDLWCSTLATTPARRLARRVAQSARRRLRITRIATAICETSLELEGHDR